jgi:hypothetical protein
MIVRVTAVAVLGSLLGATAWAQEQKFSISGNVGWILSDGVSGDARLAGDGRIYNRVDPTDSLAWGVTVGFLFGEHSEVGALFEQQESTLEISGQSALELADFTIRTYHGFYAYNFGEAEKPVRPYLLVGLGATSYPSIGFTRLNGQADEIDGNTQFSSTFALGVKVFPGKSVGLRLQARWTPTYVKSDTTGYWCDPYWGCYTAGDSQYSNQFSFTGGIGFRF